jgi:gentisate 1,2-dioxygenase
MMKNMKDRLKKFEQDFEIYVDAQDAKSYWFVMARIPRKQDSPVLNPYDKPDRLHHLHRSKKYISGLNEEGKVLVFSEPELTENYSIENWGKMDTFDDFVEKALASILAEKEESDKGMKEGCGAGCG